MTCIRRIGKSRKDILSGGERGLALWPIEVNTPLHRKLGTWNHGGETKAGWLFESRRYKETSSGAVNGRVLSAWPCDVYQEAGPGAGLSYWPQTDTLILERRELSTPTSALESWEMKKEAHRWQSCHAKEISHWGPGSQDLRITSRSQEGPQASSQQEKGNLSLTTVKKWIWPKAPWRLEALPSPETLGGSSGGLKLDCKMWGWESVWAALGRTSDLQNYGNKWVFLSR